MRYISTRGQAPELGFEEAVLKGLADDGGLYLPECYPQFTPEKIRSFRGMPYDELAFEVISPYVDGEIPESDLRAIISKSLSRFRHDAIVPLKQLNSNEWMLELFHGPTLAFKDVALQWLGNLVDYFLAKRKQPMTILGATSGDTGSAAIEGCKDCEFLDIFILHPHERVSDVQRKQMTTVRSNQVHNLAIEGNFDDCQALVKAAFRDQSFLPNNKNLVAVNSINWARIVAQIVYYFYAAAALGVPDRPISFSVPTGNFGDILAGYIAKQMGLPIDQLIVATNENDILHRCLSENDMSKHPLQHTLSPSMDIVVSSNFERMLFDAHKRNGDQIREMMSQFDQTGRLTLSQEAMQVLESHFESAAIGEADYVEAMRQVYQQTGEVIDPHTAIGVAAARLKWRDYKVPMVTLATAHALKFEQAVEAASLPNVPILPFMSEQFEQGEQYEVLPNDLKTLQDFVATHTA